MHTHGYLGPQYNERHGINPETIEPSLLEACQQYVNEGDPFSQLFHTATHCLVAAGEFDVSAEDEKVTHVWWELLNLPLDQYYWGNLSIYYTPGNAPGSTLKAPYTGPIEFDVWPNPTTLKELDKDIIVHEDSDRTISILPYGVKDDRTEQDLTSEEAQLFHVDLLIAMGKRSLQTQVALPDNVIPLRKIGASKQ